MVIDLTTPPVSPSGSQKGSYGTNSSTAPKISQSGNDTFEYSSNGSSALVPVQSQKQSGIVSGLRAKITEFFSPKEDKEELLKAKYQSEVDFAVRDMDWNMSALDGCRKDTVKKYLKNADKYQKNQKLLEGKNPIYLSPYHPNFIDIKDNLRIYFDTKEVNSDFSHETVSVNVPKRVVQAQPNQSVEGATKANIYDFEAGYVATGATMTISGTLDCESLDIINVSDAAKNDFNFAKMMQHPVSLQNVEISRDKMTVQADSMTLFFFDNNKHLVRTRTYQNPIIKYTTPDRTEFDIDAISCLVTDYDDMRPRHKSYYKDYYEYYRQGTLQRIMAQSLIKFKSDKLANVMIDYGSDRQSDGRMKHVSTFSEDVVI